MHDETVSVDRYGVMGYPISHSRSPVIHRLFALQTAQNMQYELLQVPPEKLDQAVRQFQNTGGKGLNITVPHKRAVARLCDQLSERANLAGAVNTLVFGDGDVFGDNTDGIGLLRDLTVNLRVPLAGTRILILGAGGATRGIVGPLLSAAPDTLLIANRSLHKAEVIAELFSGAGRISACGFDDVPASETFDLIINATSAGLTGDAPPYPASAIAATTVCYDLSYGIKPTPFSAWAREHRAARSVMGWGMLVEQAAESFHIWRGVRPATAPVLKQISVAA
ncbi:MAG TPA: shikimate dehydrogenase [Woeseiaceae bacterium]|nr:shikimate dehydrogenase [Woeseiaceae bacterium]